MCGLYSILVYPSKDCVVADGTPGEAVLFRLMMATGWPGQILRTTLSLRRSAV